MLRKNQVLSINALLLLVLAVVDFIRGIMHTFFNDFAADTFAQISSNPDALFLLDAFGISNFVTSFIFLIVYMKARHLSPYILLAVFVGYVIGVVGIRFADISMQSPFYGQYMMMVYLAATLIIPILYFASKDISSK